MNSFMSEMRGPKRPSLPLLAQRTDHACVQEKRCTKLSTELSRVDIVCCRSSRDE